MLVPLQHAEICLNQSVALEPSGEAMFYLAATLRLQGEDSSALAVYSDCLSLVQTKAAAVSIIENMANILEDGQKWGEAALQHRRVLQLKPADSLAAEALGRSLFYAGQPSAGSAHYRRALSLLPNNAEVHFNFGRNLELFGAPSRDLAQMHASHRHFGAAQTLATASWRERTGLQLRHWKK